MSWITIDAAAGGLVVVQTCYVVAIYDEFGAVKLATTAGGVHVLKDMTMRRAAAMVSAAADAHAARSD